MTPFETKQLLNYKQEVASIVRNIIDQTDLEKRYVEYLKENGPNRLKSETGQRLERNIETLEDIHSKLQDAYRMIAELHIDNAAANAFKLPKFKLL